MKELREDRRPADLWFWSDWFSSVDVRSCSLAAQGLWINMLSIMSRSDRKGFLSINGKPMTSKELAKFVGVFNDEVDRLLVELEYYNVFSRDEDGTIYNRRMKKLSEISGKRAEAGRLGGLKQKASKDKANKQSKHEATLEDEYEYDNEIVTKKKGVAIAFDFDTRRWSGIEAADMEGWAAAYPACDINGELAKAGEWLLANPAKRKSNYRRFIVNWLSRAQDRGGGAPSKRPAVDMRVGESAKRQHDEAYWAKVRARHAEGKRGDEGETP